MSDFVSLSCPSCGAKLQVSHDLERFACGHCGNELTVRRGGGIVSLAPVAEGLERVESGVLKVRESVDRTASELAIQRLRRDLDDLELTLAEVNNRKSIGGVAGGAILFYGLATIGGDSTGSGLLAIVVGSLILWAYISQIRTKSAAKYAVEEQMNRVRSEIDYHRLRLRDS